MKHQKYYKPEQDIERGKKRMKSLLLQNNTKRYQVIRKLGNASLRNKREV